MLLETKSLAFGEFFLDLKEKVLLRNGERLPINPKTYQLLVALIENHGHLVEKEQLMETLWPDSFVEEANLAFTISLLRKALGDDAQRPRFIETVPRRGYRFVAEVREGIVEKTSQNGTAPTISQPVEPAQPGFKRLLLPALAVLCIGAIGGGLWYARSSMLEDGPPILSAPFSLEKLSTSGRVLHAVISPDGKNVAYTSGLGADKQSVWLKQLDSSNNIQILPPSDEYYSNLAFSPDGNFLYFVRGPKPGNPAEQFAIYRISIFGGIATKIVDEVQGGMSVSPDGTRISFVRCYYRDDEYCSLGLADAADGKNERKVISLPRPFRIGDNKIAPDGRTIAFATGQSRTWANEFDLIEVDIESGVERKLTEEKFFNVKRLFWLPNQNGLLMTALKYPDKQFRIWQVSSKTGKAEALTRDSEDYSGLSLNNDADILVATQTKPDFRLNLYQADDLTKMGAGDAGRSNRDLLSPVERYSFTSGRHGNLDIWSINSDGGEQRQLTNDPLDDQGAVVSMDGDSVFFTSNRTGGNHIWRMKADGSDQTQITTVEGGSPLAVSSDGKWIFYQSALEKTLRRVSVRDGHEQLVLDKWKYNFAVSPDASHAAFVETRGEGEMLLVASLATGQTVKAFRIGGEKTRLVAMTWSNDGKEVFYIAAKNDYENNTLWIQPLNEQSPRLIADLPGEAVRGPSRFAVSPDSKNFAVIQGYWKRDAVLIKGLR